MAVKSQTVDPEEWEGSCVHEESTMHQLAPYLGKMKSTMARSLIEAYTETGDTILDPFSGSGTIGLEGLLCGRNVLLADINPYAKVLTLGKINPPSSENDALIKANEYIKEMYKRATSKSLDKVPDWVCGFFHEDTLKEILSIVPLLREGREYFLLSCLLGILHHQRPGFLSYPSSHMVPYLRDEKYPEEDYPEKYEYREVEERLIAKIKRAYRRFPGIDEGLISKFYDLNVRQLDLESHSVDTVITSPPYHNTLDYARDNRLRMWFLDVDNFKKFDERVSPKGEYVQLVKKFLKKVGTFLKADGKCVIVVGEQSRRGNNTKCAAIIREQIEKNVDELCIIESIQDDIPGERRARKDHKSTENEQILVLEKQ